MPSRSAKLDTKSLLCQCLALATLAVAFWLASGICSAAQTAVPEESHGPGAVRAGDIASQGQKGDLYDTFCRSILSHLANWGDENWDVVIGIDTSGSMSDRNQLTDAAKVIRTFLCANLVPGDNVSVFEFGPKVLNEETLPVPADPDPSAFEAFLGRIGTDPTWVFDRVNQLEGTDLVAAKLHALRELHSRAGKGRNAAFFLFTDQADQPPPNASDARAEVSRLLDDVRSGGVWLYSLPEGPPCVSVVWGFRHVGGPPISIRLGNTVIHRRAEYLVTRPYNMKPFDAGDHDGNGGDDSDGGLLVIAILVVLLASAAVVLSLLRHVSVTLEQISPPGMAQSFSVGRGASVAIGGAGDETNYYPITGIGAAIAYVVGEFPRRIDVRKADEEDSRTRVIAAATGLSWRIEHTKPSSGEMVVVEVRRGLAATTSEQSTGPETDRDSANY
jgi:hypothetical protein